MPIHSATFLTSAPSIHTCPEQTGHEFAFIGRSNVGKSTLINTICNQKNLANVSGKPGKTQLVNFFTVQSGDQETRKERHLVDLPGYGYARVSKKHRSKRQNIITEFLRKRPLTMVFVLIDSSIGVQDIDIEFLIRLENKRIIYTIVFTKADKNNQKQAHAHFKKFSNACQSEQIELPDYFIVNKKKPKSIHNLVAYIEDLVV